MPPPPNHRKTGFCSACHCTDSNADSSLLLSEVAFKRSMLCKMSFSFKNLIMQPRDGSKGMETKNKEGGGAAEGAFLGSAGCAPLTSPFKCEAGSTERAVVTVPSSPLH